MVVPNYNRFYFGSLKANVLLEAAQHVPSRFEVEPLQVLLRISIFELVLALAGL